MRSILIDPVTKTVAAHTIDGGLASLQAAVGGLIAYGTELKTGDLLYVDDEGLLKPNPSFFALGRRSFAGRGLLVGPERGAFITDVVSTVQEIAEMVRFNVSMNIDKLLTAKMTTFHSADEFFEYLRRQRNADRA